MGVEFEYKLASKTVVKQGVELPWQEVERYGSDLLYTSGPRKGEVMYPDRQVTGTVKAVGSAFVELSILEELCEQDNSYGMGGAYIINDSRAGLALEQADLATCETRGGYYTTSEQRKKLKALMDALYARIED